MCQDKNDLRAAGSIIDFAARSSCELNEHKGEASTHAHRFHSGVNSSHKHSSDLDEALSKGLKQIDPCDTLL